MPRPPPRRGGGMRMLLLEVHHVDPRRPPHTHVLTANGAIKAAASILKTHAGRLGVSPRAISWTLKEVA